MIIKKHIYKILFIVWSALITTFSSIPSLNLNPSPIIGTDKIAHFTEYFIFSLLFIKLHKDSRKGLLNLIWLALFIPLLDELHQIPIPGRDFSIYDILADTLGFLVAIIIYAPIHASKVRKKKKQ